MARLTNVISSPKVRQKTKNKRNKRYSGALSTNIAVAMNVPQDIAYKLIREEPSAALALAKGTGDIAYNKRVLRKALKEIQANHVEPAPKAEISFSVNSWGQRAYDKLAIDKLNQEIEPKHEATQDVKMSLAEYNLKVKEVNKLAERYAANGWLSMELDKFKNNHFTEKTIILAKAYFRYGGNHECIPSVLLTRPVRDLIRNGFAASERKQSSINEGTERTREVIQGAKKSVEEFKAKREPEAPKASPKPEAVTLSDKGLNDLLKSDNQEALKCFLGVDSGVSLTSFQLDQIKKRLAVLKSQTAKKGSKKQTTRTGTTRTNQSDFRERGLLYYGECVVTGTKCESMLEAAHIVPFSGDNEDLENCLILRADLHNAFDAFDWSINPNTLCIELGEELKQDPCFLQYHGKKLNLYTKAEYIRTHYSGFKSK